MPTLEYLAALRTLSERLVAAQAPIRVLDAIKWTDEIGERFVAEGCTELPRVDADYYAQRPLPFDPKAKRAELNAIERDTRQTLGDLSPVGRILRRMCDEYVSVVRMLEARGTPEFSTLSQELYGSARDVFHAGDPTIADLGMMMSSSLDAIAASGEIADEAQDISADKAVELLQARLDQVFTGDDRVTVKLSDGIIADAAAGADYIKLRADAKFSSRQLRMLEIHEGWVHLGTHVNGRSQPYCTFLAKGPPSSTITQEGLAIFMELVTFTSHPNRLRRLANRVQGVRLAEDGADFLEVFRHYRAQGYAEAMAYSLAVRVFRGSLPTGGPFTKDLAYSRGFVLVYNYVQMAVQRGLLGRIPLLFCGKTSFEDLRVLADLVDEGVVTAPRFLPPQIADLHALAAWMCYSNFLTRLDFSRLAADYGPLL